MAKRLTFAMFSDSVRSLNLPLDKLSEYVEFDRHWPIPKLCFRSDALLDQPPATYDLDDEIRRMLRTLNRERREQRRLFSFTGKTGVVAEGDSWFSLRYVIGRYAIAEHIEEDARFRMSNIAFWGYTLKKILEEKDYMGEIRDENPDFFMLSAGGNDLQLGLANGNYIHNYEPKRPVDKYLTNDGEQGIIQIGTQYQELLGEVHNAFPKLPIICHGYDYPRPLADGGKYIGQYLRDNHHIPDELMVPILIPVVNKLNDVIEKVACSIKTAHYLNLRTKTEMYTWHDDMHPENDGFKALATFFEDEMTIIRLSTLRSL